MQLVWNSLWHNTRTWAAGGILSLVLCSVALLWLPPLSAARKNALGQFLGLAAATLVSEDLTTINAGVLIAQGRISATLGLLACFFGIFFGDVLLFLAGRYLGRAALHRAPLKWLLTAAAVERSSTWLQQRGLAVIALSRFVPGMRLPTYFAAGVLQTDFRLFTGYFFIACALWTPLLIGAAVWLGGAASAGLLARGRAQWWPTILVGLALFAVLKLSMRLTTWRGRRALVGWWRRWSRWEFWPPYVFYPPVLFYLLWLAVRHRCLTLFTAANPAIPASGFVGESKAAILDGLRDTGEWVARYELLSAGASLAERTAQAQHFMQQHGLAYPVVLKPDVGQRGSGVRVVRSAAELVAYLRAANGAVILQEYIAGAEFGVFYYRLPHEAQGRIFSITHKTFPVVTGDGQHTVEELILKDDRAVALARDYCAQHTDKLDTILPPGECLQLVELGTHCRGSIFLDGARFNTPALTLAIDHLSRRYAGFYFGRYDLRAASTAAFARGEFKVLELNGVTAEATHIYDPQYSLLTAYCTLFAQWRIAFEIGAQLRARGVEVSSWRELARLLCAFRQPARSPHAFHREAA
jgi:membrane protein DedA with SNARE-associated domain